MVLRRDHFLSYADWVLDILQKLEKTIDTSEYDDYQKRVFGFVAERLANVYVDYLVERHGARHKELALAYGIFNYDPVSARSIGNVADRGGDKEPLLLNESIQVAFAIDSGFSAHCATAIYSMLSRLHSEQKIDVHVLSDGGLTEEARLGLTSTAASWPHAQIVFHDIDAGRFKHLPMNRKHVSVATYFRLVLQHVLPVSRVIYLDSDLLVLDNIAKLWSENTDGKPVAACPDEGGGTQMRRLRLEESQRYFNGGVLLLDLDLLRKRDADRLYQEAFAAYRERIILQDQDILNIAFAGQTKRLDLRWNAQSRLFAPNKFDFSYSEQEAKAARENPAILHFTDSVKPWQAECMHPYVGLYWQFRKRTRFRPGLRERALVALKRIVVRFPQFTALLVRIRNRARLAVANRQGES
jgi:lipopolysaccharide biosynthesis glycosyltransferase